MLTDKSVNSLDDLQNVIKDLHKMGPQTVAVSSAEMNNKMSAVISSLKGILNNVLRIAYELT